MTITTKHDPINRRQFSRDLLRAIHPCEQQQQQQQTSWLTFRIKLVSKRFHIIMHSHFLSKALADRSHAPVWSFLLTSESQGIQQGGRKLQQPAPVSGYSQCRQLSTVPAMTSIDLLWSGLVCQ